MIVSFPSNAPRERKAGAFTEYPMMVLPRDRSILLDFLAREGYVADLNLLNNSVTLDKPVKVWWKFTAKWANFLLRKRPLV